MNKISKLFGVLALSAIALTGCSGDDDNNNGSSSSFVLDPTNFQGNINDGTITLSAGTVYELSGPLTIKDGATLSIPAGTRIEATGGTSAYIAVAQGGKILINGTASNPVVMTSGLSTPAAGNWGGLVICGRAPINRGATASAEVSELAYGGNMANDNSGSIRYLRIEYCGAAFNSEKEFNGISFFGVGNGTVVENVQVFHGADDGFEFFGGTVNTSNLVAIGNEDDEFDWTEGWNGTNTNWYGKKGFGIGNRGIEADNLEANFDASPTSNPTINNLTLIGGITGSAEPDAIKFRRGTKAMMNNVVLSNFTDGFDVENDQTISFVGTALKATNVKFESITNTSKGKDTAGATVDVSGVFTESTTATGAGNGTGTPSWATGWTTGF
ncbi:MAG TPA: hypothetical protein VGB50_12140 [Flavobacterium sp.]|jgi:hypothetical protein